MISTARRRSANPLVRKRHGHQLEQLLCRVWCSLRCRTPRKELIDLGLGPLGTAFDVEIGRHLRLEIIRRHRRGVERPCACDLADETAGGRLGAGGLEGGEQKPALGARHRDEQQPALFVDGEVLRRLLLEQLDRDEHAFLTRVGELPLDQPGHDHRLVLQALGLVNGHQLDALDVDTTALLGVQVSAGLLVDVEIGDELRQAVARMRRLPVGDETHQPGQREHGPLRIWRLHRDEVVEHVGTHEEVLEHRERPVALSARHELVDQVREPFQFHAQARVELLTPPLRALLTISPLLDRVGFRGIEICLCPQGLRNRGEDSGAVIRKGCARWLGNRDLTLAQHVERGVIDGTAVPRRRVGQAQDLGRIEAPGASRKEANERGRIFRVGGHPQRGLDIAHLGH